MPDETRKLVLGDNTSWITLAVFVGLGLTVAVVLVLLGRRTLNRARDAAQAVLSEARRDAKNKQRELAVLEEERALARQEEIDSRERELDERESRLESRQRQLEQRSSELGQQRKQLDKRQAEAEEHRERAREAREKCETAHAVAQQNLERIAGLSADEARTELVAGIEQQAREDAARLARKIEDDARHAAEAKARNLIVQSCQRVNLHDVLESTVSFIELPNDEMKGRIIGKEGRNIRALEMATGVDLIVDDTPRSIWLSCFDPVRREIARVSLDQLLEDGRIHPARIEDVVSKVRDEIANLIEEKGGEAAYSLGISDMNPQLLRLVGRMRYHTSHGQNLLQHALETALVAGFMAQDLGGRVDVVHRAGLLHEVGHVSENTSEHSLFCSAEFAARHGEPDEVIESIRSLHPDVSAQSLEAQLLATANRLSENRPGARKENLAVFIERLRRLEAIAEKFDGVQRAFAVKAGKELRVIVDARKTGDDTAFALSRNIARTLERELSYPGQIKVCVVRETRAVRFAV